MFRPCVLATTPVRADGDYVWQCHNANDVAKANTAMLLCKKFSQHSYLALLLMRAVGH
jgi:hypothetical protein